MDLMVHCFGCVRVPVAPKFEFLRHVPNREFEIRGLFAFISKWQTGGRARTLLYLYLHFVSFSAATLEVSCVGDLSSDTKNKPTTTRNRNTKITRFSGV
jgi:hypothetical protein